MTHKTQVNIRIPDIESLYCINCKVNPVDMQDPLVKSLFHSQILTCRLIIYTMRCCIASPSIQNSDDLIHVIVNKSFYNSGKFQEHLSKLKVDYTDPKPVYPKIYEACLKYTFTFRLAPHWNSIGKSYYLQGFNFLSLTSNINAVEWNILFKNSNDIKLELIPIKMNLFPLTLDSLSLPPKTVDGFLSNLNINSIDLTSYESPWVYILPKLTKARIISISKILPESSPFQNYNDLRRHWKNMYSYRLPKSEQGLLYYEVVFPSKPNQYFTYPEICILCKMPELLMCDNKKEVALQFLKDLSSNVHSVCGDVIQICQLYPELDIEYSCVLRKTNQICENQYSQLQQSSFFKTPGELIVKPVNEKLNLSSLFNFKGMDKMKSDMQNHRQQVLSIMQNNKRKNKSIVVGNDNGHLTQSMFKNKKRKFEMSQKYLPSIPEIKQEKTIVNNLDDVISYHDLPSMYSKNTALEGSDEDKDFQQKEDKSANQMHQSYKPQPVIKNVENVYFDVTNVNLLTNSNELKIDKNKTNNQDSNSLDTKNCNTTQSIPKLSNSVENMPQNLNFDQCKKELRNSLSFDQDNMYCKLQSSIHSIDLNNKVLSKLLPKQTSDKSLHSIETQSYDKKIRSFLSAFDLYNMHGRDEIDIENQLSEQYKMSFAISDENDKVSSKTVTKSTLMTSFKKSEFLENYQNNFENDSSLNEQPDKSSEYSPSLLNLEKGSSPDVCHTKSKAILNKNTKYLEPEKDYVFENYSTVKNKHEFYGQSVSKTNLVDSKAVLQHKNHEQTFFETPQISTFTHNTFENSINKKQHSRSPIDKNSLKSEVEYIKTSEFAQNNKTRNNENSCRELHDSSFTSDSLKNSCKTPSLYSIFESADNSGVLNKCSNSPQYSTHISHSEVQNQNILHHKKDINEFAEQSDFLSILSESSNGSDTGDYESCKLVFNEAFTLKK